MKEVNHTLTHLWFFVFYHFCLCIYFLILPKWSIFNASIASCRIDLLWIEFKWVNLPLSLTSYSNCKNGSFLLFSQRSRYKNGLVKTQYVEWSKNYLMKAFFLFFQFYHAASRILVPRSGIKSRLSAVEVWNLNHWTTREVPACLFLLRRFLYLFMCSYSVSFQIGFKEALRNQQLNSHKDIWRLWRENKNQHWPCASVFQKQC